MRRKLYALAAGLAALLLANGAQAHPHMWIDASVILHMKGGKIEAVTHRWSFDPRFSIVLLGHFDKNRNRHFDKAELEELKAGGFSNLESLSYFTNVRVDGAYQKITKVRSFAAKVEGQKVVYEFTVALAAPINPRSTQADFLFIDRTYYVDVGVDKVTLTGGSGCKAEQHDDKENPIYYGMVIPKKTVVSCAAG